MSPFAQHRNSIPTVFRRKRIVIVQEKKNILFALRNKIFTYRSFTSVGCWDQNSHAQALLRNSCYRFRFRKNELFQPPVIVIHDVADRILPWSKVLVVCSFETNCKLQITQLEIALGMSFGFSRIVLNYLYYAVFVVCTYVLNTIEWFCVHMVRRCSLSKPYFLQQAFNIYMLTDLITKGYWFADIYHFRPVFRQREPAIELAILRIHSLNVFWTSSETGLRDIHFMSDMRLIRLSLHKPSKLTSVTPDLCESIYEEIVCYKTK